MGGGVRFRKSRIVGERKIRLIRSFPTPIRLRFPNAFPPPTPVPQIGAVPQPPVKIVTRPVDLPLTSSLKIRSYDKLDDNGLAPLGTRVSGEDVLIRKTTPITPDDAQGQAAGYTKRDHSTSLRYSETGMVDQVLLTTNADGLRFVKVRMRSIRILQIGDKFCNRHGQKETVGMT
ncbi:unnamed protein product [Fraxinus pennsylvanica]|uniref:DNA-directed RNA polymerase n=1 Tax=Fraxinus pennsylvanica TaxID=56036 RepID=A0AAD2E354_9LAMI|nr:unnamed protein product [Fraxinus pennsylvanica]